MSKILSLLLISLLGGFGGRRRGWLGGYWCDELQQKEERGILMFSKCSYLVMGGAPTPLIQAIVGDLWFATIWTPQVLRPRGVWSVLLSLISLFSCLGDLRLNTYNEIGCWPQQRFVSPFSSTSKSRWHCGHRGLTAFFDLTFNYLEFKLTIYFFFSRKRNFIVFS